MRSSRFDGARIVRSDEGSPVSLRINHVSVNARDLQRVHRLLRRAPRRRADRDAQLRHPRPVARARAAPSCTCSSATSHPTSHHHFGDHRRRRRARLPRRRALRTPSTTRRSSNRLVELPGDVVQLYVRDPAGNLVEIDHHGVDRLPDDLRARLQEPVGLQPARRRADERAAVRAGLSSRHKRRKTDRRSCSLSS